MDMADHRGMTALHYAAGRGRKEVASLLLQATVLQYPYEVA